MNCSICGKEVTLLDPCPECAAKKNTLNNEYNREEIPGGSVCLIHPANPSVHMCKICHAPICITCDFNFGNNIHLCPKCVNKPIPTSVEKKKKLIISYILGSIAIISLILNFILPWIMGIEMYIKFAKTIGIIFVIAALVLPIIGISMAVDSRTRNRKIQKPILISLIINGSIIGIFIIMVIINLFSILSS